MRVLIVVFVLLFVGCTEYPVELHTEQDVPMITTLIPVPSEQAIIFEVTEVSKVTESELRSKLEPLLVGHFSTFIDYLDGEIYPNYDSRTNGDLLTNAQAGYHYDTFVWKDSGFSLTLEVKTYCRGSNAGCVKSYTLQVVSDD